MYLGDKEGWIMVRPLVPYKTGKTMETILATIDPTSTLKPRPSAYPAPDTDDMVATTGRIRKLMGFLIDYADYRKYQSLINYIEAGGNLDVQLDHTYHLTTPLCEASKRYDTCAMNSMFEKNVDVNFPDGHGNTPLFLAAKCHKIGSVYILLQKGAEPDICNRLGKTPLSVAMENFSNHCADLLVDAGASVNVPIAARRGLLCIPGDTTSPLLFALLFSPSPFPMAFTLLYAGALPEVITEEALAIILNRPGTQRQFLELLFDAGFHIKSKTWIKQREAALRDDTISAREVDFLDCLKVESSAPRSLQSLARTQIRTCVTLNRKVKGHIKKKLDSLPLPKSVLEYLKL